MLNSFQVIVFFFTSCSYCFAQKISFWGTWEYGGDSQAGVVYSIDTKGNFYNEFYSFPSTIGEWPKGDLCEGKEGVYYGIAGGGLYKGGVLFQFNLKTNGYKILHHFDKSERRNPQGGLIYRNGLLYGVTYEGGKNRKGTIFKYDLEIDSISVLHHFEDKNEYSNIGRKTKLSLYGRPYLALPKRVENTVKAAYSLNLDDYTFKNCIDFDDSIGTNPLAPLTISTAGKIFGSTSKGITAKDGKIFKYNPDEGKLNILLSFEKVDGNYLQSQMILEKDSVLIGVTSYGGSGNSGLVFEYKVLFSKWISFYFMELIPSFR